MNAPTDVSRRDAPSVESLLGRLRGATGPLHESLDRKLALQTVAMTRSRYASFLRGTLAIVEPLEGRIADFIMPRDPVSRASVIRRDLAALGERSEPLVVEAPLIDDRAEALGAAYVLEGSTLGGLVLATSLERTLDLPESALGYLRFRGRETAPCWRAFLAELEVWSSASSARLQERACESAVATFRAYEAAYAAAGLFGGAE